MIRIKKKEECCGCNLCAEICPTKCITMQADDEGFLYPQCNEKACISCGRCERICPVLNKKPLPLNSHRKAFAAINNDETIRLSSSSGGLFTAIAEQVLGRKGVVCGVAFNENFETVHTFVENENDLSKFRGSKYVQSRVGDAYKRVLEFLKAGRYVLFSGTPCQIAALKAFLGRDYETLVTVDLICLGVFSPMIWKKYIGYRKENDSLAPIEFISFRSKIGGGISNFRVEYGDGTVYQKPSNQDPMWRAYNAKICLRPSCHDCVFRNRERDSDITLADFWGIEKVLPDFSDGCGVSLVISHSPRGQAILETLIENDLIRVQEVEYEKAIAGNPAMLYSPPKPISRDRFLRDIRQGENFCKVVEKRTKKSFVRRSLGKLRKKLLLRKRK